MHAYNELYLNDAKLNLGQYFSYLVDDCGYSVSNAWEFFLTSGTGELFDKGNPAVLSGMSGIELARKAIDKSYGDMFSAGAKLKEPSSSYNMERSPSYWVGWALAEYQWFTGRRFRDIARAIPIKDISSMFKAYHEMDISQFIDELEKRICSFSDSQETRLRHYREKRGLSQSKLAELSGVHLRSIQMYEQKQNEINKAQGITLYRLSRVLGCNIEDLLENPSML